MKLSTIIRLVCLSAILVSLEGCRAWAERSFEYAYGDSLIGSPIENVFPTFGQPERIELTDRGTESYVYPWPRRSCTIFWEVADGKIIAMEHEGKGCTSGPFND